MKQVLFLDIENNKRHGGILTDEGDIICGCCGGLIPADEIGDSKDYTATIITIYDNWIDLDETVCGDDLYLDDEDDDYADECEDDYWNEKLEQKLSK